MRQGNIIQYKSKTRITRAPTSKSGALVIESNHLGLRSLVSDKTQVDATATNKKPTKNIIGIAA